MTPLKRYSLPTLLLLFSVLAGVMVWSVTKQHGTSVQQCAVIRTLAHVESEFLRSDAYDRKGDLTAVEREQDIRGFEKIIPSASLRDQIRRQQWLDNWTIKYWRTTLVPETLALVKKANCSAE